MTTKDEFVLNNLVAQLEKTTDAEEIEELKKRILEIDPEFEFTEEVIEDEKVSLGDRKNMLFSSSLITYGRGKGVVVETGMNTEVGKIADIINTAEESGTPLQQKLDIHSYFFYLDVVYLGFFISMVLGCLY